MNCDQNWIFGVHTVFLKFGTKMIILCLSIAQYYYFLEAIAHTFYSHNNYMHAWQSTILTEIKTFFPIIHLRRVVKMLNFFGNILCTLILVTYRCYVGEHCGSNHLAVSMISFASNDGERLCCNGTFASWDVSSSPTGGSPCTMCPGMFHDCT